uniref:Uncharacterized protein n=1 Tax=Caenorhabditis japonica TaxID=281687 RepID=A0A8R1EMT2_CAEJA
MENSDKVSHSVKFVELCLESRLLLVSGISGQVTLFRFTKQEVFGTIAVVNVAPFGNYTASTCDLEKSTGSSGPKEIRRQKKARKTMNRALPEYSENHDESKKRKRTFAEGSPSTLGGSQQSYLPHSQYSDNALFIVFLT